MARVIAPFFRRVRAELLDPTYGAGLVANQHSNDAREASGELVAWLRRFGTDRQVVRSAAQPAVADAPARRQDKQRQKGSGPLKQKLHGNGQASQRPKEPNTQYQEKKKHVRTPEEHRAWLKETGRWVEPSQFQHKRTPEEHREWLKAQGRVPKEEEHRARLKETGRWVEPSQFQHKRTPEEHREWLKTQGRVPKEERGGDSGRFAPSFANPDESRSSDWRQAARNKNDAGHRRRQRGATLPRGSRRDKFNDDHYYAEKGVARTKKRWGKRAGGASQPAGRRPSAVEQPSKPLQIPPEVTVVQLAALYDVPIPRLEDVLGSLGSPPSSEQEIVGAEDAELAALELGFAAQLSPEAVTARATENAPDARPRPAVVTVMGHVDHGKTSLLDALRKSSIAAREAGGITQHIGAFYVPLPFSGAALTFLDTPGHAAFGAMRARGASVTDIVVLVVAADDGVMPQTEEALAHARASGVPVVVALTKCDLPGAQPARVRNALLGLGLELEDVGGSVQVVEVAAPRGVGLDALEEALLLQAEMLELRASPTVPATGTVIEARLDKGRGPVATVVVREGTLQVGDIVVAGTEWGRVRAVNAGGPVVGQAGPGEPAEITGLKGVPAAGDSMTVVMTEKRAQALSGARAKRAAMQRHEAAARAVAEREENNSVDIGSSQQTVATGSSTTQINNALSSQPTVVMPIVVKADVQGSVEAVADALAALSCKELELRVVHSGVGPVSASDIQLAVPLNARIVAFGVRTGGLDIEAAIKRHGLTLHRHNVIYKLLEELGEAMLGAAPRVEKESVAGEATVLQTFEIRASRGREPSTVAGCRVSKGSLRAGQQFRVLRAGNVVHEGRCASLRRGKQAVDAVGRGNECGVVLEGFADYQPGDTLECIAIEMVRPESLTAIAAK